MLHKDEWNDQILKQDTVTFLITNIENDYWFVLNLYLNRMINGPHKEGDGNRHHSLKERTRVKLNISLLSWWPNSIHQQEIGLNRKTATIATYYVETSEACLLLAPGSRHEKHWKKTQSTLRLFSFSSAPFDTSFSSKSDLLYTHTQCKHFS